MNEREQLKHDQEIYQRMTNMAVRYQIVNSLDQKRSLDKEVQNYLWENEPKRFQKFWVYYLIRRED